MLIRRAQLVLQRNNIELPPAWEAFLDGRGEFQTDAIMRIATEDELLTLAATLGMTGAGDTYLASVTPTRDACNAAIAAAVETYTNTVNALIAQRDARTITPAEFRAGKSAAVQARINVTNPQESALRTVVNAARTTLITTLDGELDRLNAL